MASLLFLVKLHLQGYSAHSLSYLSGSPIPYNEDEEDFRAKFERFRVGSLCYSNCCLPFISMPYHVYLGPYVLACLCLLINSVVCSLLYLLMFVHLSAHLLTHSLVHQFPSSLLSFFSFLSFPSRLPSIHPSTQQKKREGGGGGVLNKI